MLYIYNISCKLHIGTDDVKKNLSSSAIGDLVGNNVCMPFMPFVCNSANTEVCP